LVTTDESKADHGISSITGSGELSYHDTMGPPTSTYENAAAPLDAAPSNDLGDFDFNQMLDQQFLDPSWLESI
jgi:hypothetical protein